MKIRPIFQFVLLALFALPFSAHAELQAVAADRSVPFGVAQGQLLLLDQQIVFADVQDPSKTFAVARSEVSSANVRDGIVTVLTNTPIAGSTTHTFRIATSESLDLAAWLSAEPATSAEAAPASDGEEEGFRYEFDVEEERTLAGDESGKLILTQDQIRYVSITEADRSFTWEYRDVKEFIRKNQNKIKIKSFAGADYTFTLIGEGLTSSDYRAIADRISASQAR